MQKKTLVSVVLAGLVVAFPQFGETLLIIAQSIINLVSQS